MRRALASLALASAAALAAWSSLATRVPPRAAPAECKPFAPLDVVLAPAAPQEGARGGPGAGQDGLPAAGTVPVEFTIQPVCDMLAVEWAWEFSPGITLLDGERSGTAQPESGALTAGAATLAVPDDGGYHSAALIVTASFTGSDAAGTTGPETVRVAGRLTWGEMPPAVPVLLTPEGPGTAWVPVAVVPVLHEAAR